MSIELKYNWLGSSRCGKNHNWLGSSQYDFDKNIISYNLLIKKYKLGENWFSLVQFHLVHSSVQVPTWLWSKSSIGLIGTKGLCIGFIDIDALVGQYQ